MKFTKEQAFENLKSQLTNNGRKTLRMSEKSLNSQVETLMAIIADDEMELDVFVEKVKPSFEVMNSNAEYDRSNFIREWKKEHPEDVDDKKKTKTDDEPSKKIEENEVIKGLLEQVKALQDKQAADEKNKSIAEKSKELKSLLKEKGIEDTDWTNMMLSEIAITEDLDVNAKAENLLKIYNKQQSTTTKKTPAGSSFSKETERKPFAGAIKLMEERNKAQNSFENK